MQPATDNTRPAAQSADQTQLIAMSQTLVDACPDLRQMARDLSQEILQKYNVAALEPDHVWWHQFKWTAMSPRTFTGWEHLVPPAQSLTLPQLAMQRFSASAQTHADELSQYGGFYNVDGHHDEYDERNEVRLLPLNVMNDFWAIDFRVRYLDKLKAFWRDHADDFRTLAKAHFIGRALEDHHTGWLTDQDLHALMDAIGVDPSQPPTLKMLQAHAPTDAKPAFHTFDVVGYTASDILRLVLANGRQILYTPGEEQVFHPFDTDHDLNWWLLSQNNRAENRLRFMSHFSQSSHVEEGSTVGLHHALDLLYSTWGTHGPSLVNRSSQRLQADPFSHLRDAAKSRMFADADVSLHSNADLRKQMWIGLLGAFTRITGPLAALDWPIALAAVGAGLAETGLNVDQAINGHTTAERKAGVIGAVLSGIDTLFNSLFLIHPVLLSSAADLTKTETVLKPGEPATTPAAEVEAPFSAVTDLETLAPGPVYPGENSRLLEPFESNVLLDSDTPSQAAGKMKGIFVQPGGATYIAIDEMAYAVRYVDELKSWVIIDPENPFSFYRSLPVKLSESGLWEPLTRSGLKGGGKVFGKLGWGRSASVRPITEPLSSPYDMPEALRDELRAEAERPINKGVQGFARISSTEADPFIDFRAIREQLAKDAQAFYKQLELPARPKSPVVSGAPAKQVIKGVYRNTEGLVVGEVHASVGSKQFLIENMPLLARQKVRTLYMEHLMTDFHQADLDTFAQTGTMPRALERYLDIMDAGFRTDPSGRYTFKALVKTANENHIRIQAIDCMASYRLKGLPDPQNNLRDMIMNFQADRVIKANQARIGGGKWVALVGNAHSNTFRGVTGVAELEGALGLRVEEVAADAPTGFDVDEGALVQERPSQRPATLKNDLLLKVAKQPTASFEPVESRLTEVGNFAIKRMGRLSELVHHSKDGSLVRTPIQLTNDRLFITRPTWPQVSGRRFESFEELARALTATGMKEID